MRAPTSSSEGMEAKQALASASGADSWLESSMTGTGVPLALIGGVPLMPRVQTT